jgi:hypothetical protein
MPGVKSPLLSTQVTQHRAVHAHLANKKADRKETIDAVSMHWGQLCTSTCKAPLSHGPWYMPSGAGHATVAFERRHLLIGFASFTCIKMPSFRRQRFVSSILAFLLCPIYARSSAAERLVRVCLPRLCFTAA